MFQLLITVNLKSSVGAVVAISQTIAEFDSEQLAETAFYKLTTLNEVRINSAPYSARTVERLYNPTKK